MFKLILFTCYYLLLSASCLHNAALEWFSGKFDIILVLNNAFWVFNYTKIIAFSMHAGSLTPIEARKTANIVHKIINQGCIKIDRHCLKKVSRFSVEILYNI